MSYKPEDFGPIDANAELRDIVLKSSFSGVAATVLAVVVCSPAGLGGMIGTSMASLGFNSIDSSKTGENALVFPTATPMTQSELQTIRERLASSAASIDNMRAATDSEIEFMRNVAEHHNALAFNAPSHFTASVEPAQAVAAVGSHLELAELLVRKEPV